MFFSRALRASYGGTKGVYQKEGGVSYSSHHIVGIAQLLKVLNEMLGCTLQQASSYCASCLILAVRMGTLKIRYGSEQEMGAITAVPREVVPLVNHSPGFALLGGSGVLFQRILLAPGAWQVQLLQGGKSRRLVVPPASLLCSLLTMAWAAGAGRIRTHQTLNAV